MPTLRKVAVLLLLAALLVSPLASAARPMPGNPEPATAELASRAILRHIAILLTSVWAKAGCHINPNGLCVTGTAPAPSPAHQVEEGCHIDPSGCYGL